MPLLLFHFMSKEKVKFDSCLKFQVPLRQHLESAEPLVETHVRIFNKF